MGTLKIPGAPEFKTWYFPSGNILSIFVEGGSARINTNSGEGTIERISKRPLFYQLNFLHYNPGRWWKYFSRLRAKRKFYSQSPVARRLMPSSSLPVPLLVSLASCRVWRLLHQKLHFQLQRLQLLLLVRLRLLEVYLFCQE